LLSGSSKSTDNTLVSVSPISEDFYALTEAPSVNRIDPKTLEVLENTNFSDKMGFVMLTAHPQVMEDGTVFNVGHSIGSSGGFYNFVCFPKDKRDISNPKILATIQSRFKYHPTYIHSFGITENYFIVFETPFVLSVPQLAKSLLMKIPFIDCLKWLENEQTRIILVNRETGDLQFEFFADPFFCFHSINQYEADGNVILDLCCYENADVVEAVRVEKLVKNDANAIGKFFAKPLRFVLPIGESNEKNVNLVKIEGSKATAVLKEDRKFFCTPELLADITFEFPRINNPKYLTKKYKYFYGVCVELDEHVGAIVKVDVEKKSKVTWKDGKMYAFEPFFVPSPNAVEEDDGVIVAGFLTSGTANQVGIVILDAKDLKELARAEFKDLPTAITKPFHGWYLADE
jgi:carotenoid isomerooxygenase